MKNSIAVFIFAIFVIGLFPTAFIFAQNSSPDAIQALQEQIAELQKQIADLQAQLEIVKKTEVPVTESIRFTKTLQRGIRDAEVTKLQEFLKQYPDIYPEGLVTGYFGPLTEAAVKRFQEKHSIETVGIVGPRTRAKLNELFSAKPITPEEIVKPEEKKEIPSPQPIGKCSDGTLYGQCVAQSKPKYCENGNLIDECNICGCPTGQECQIIGSCKVITTQTLLLLVEDTLYKGLISELNTYSEDIQRELGFETIVKTFPFSASVFEVKSYIDQIYNNYELNGVLLIGNLPTGKLYTQSRIYSSKDNLPLYDHIYQDIYNICEYSKEWDAFDYGSPCVQNRIQPFWVSRLTPNSSSRDSLLLLKDYFKRNHQYRTGSISYKPKVLVYNPILSDASNIARMNTKAEIEDDLTFFNMYNETGYHFIDIEKEDSDTLYLNEIKKPYEYENVFFNGHGLPDWHQKDISPADVVGTSFFFADLRSCSVGRFTTKDYIAGKYLFEGEGLVVPASSVVYRTPDYPAKEVYYLLSVGEPVYEALRVDVMGLGAFTNLLGDPTLKMRYYFLKPTYYQSNDPIINFNYSRLYFTNNQSKIALEIKNSGNSTLKFTIAYRFLRFKEEWEGVRLNFLGEEVYELPPQSKKISTFEFPFDADPPAGIYRGEIHILSNDPVNPRIIIPFEATVE